MAKLPTRLRNAPIATAIFEFRYDSHMDGLAELLPGMLYSSLREHFPTINRLPPAEIPLAIRRTMADWQFQGVHQIATSDGLVSVNFAERAITLQVLAPYPGWDKFIGYVSVLINAISPLNLIGKVRRYSLRYQNVLDKGILPSMDELHLTVKLGGETPLHGGLTVRGEYDFSGTHVVVQIASEVNVAFTIDGQQRSLNGALVDVDVMDLDPPADFLQRHTELLGTLHDREKSVFFSLLSPGVVERLGPVWE